MNFSETKALITPLISLSRFLIRSYASVGVYPISTMSLSSLLNTRHTCRRSSQACLSTAWVCTQMPSTTSTTTSPPSLRRAAVKPRAEVDVPR